MNVYLRDRQAGTTKLVSRNPWRSTPHEYSGSATLSADGRFVAYTASAGATEPSSTTSNGIARARTATPPAWRTRGVTRGPRAVGHREVSLDARGGRAGERRRLRPRSRDRRCPRAPARRRGHRVDFLRRPMVGDRLARDRSRAGRHQRPAGYVRLRSHRQRNDAPERRTVRRGDGEPQLRGDRVRGRPLRGVPVVRVQARGRRHEPLPRHLRSRPARRLSVSTYRRLERAVIDEDPGDPSHPDRAGRECERHRGRRCDSRLARYSWTLRCPPSVRRYSTEKTQPAIAMTPAGIAT